MREIYDLQIKVRNNLLLRQMKRRGIKNAVELAKISGVHQCQIGCYLNFKRKPLARSGKEFSRNAIKLAEALDVSPFEIFPEEHLDNALENNKAEIEIGRDEMLQLISQSRSEDPEAILIRDEEERSAKEIISNAILHLRPREELVLRRRWGLGDKEPETYRKIANDLAVSLQRVRVIEDMAKRKIMMKIRTKEMAGISRGTTE